MKLIALPYSPWSVKAHWALDALGADYKLSNYTPLVGVPWLRWRTQVFTGRITVPALIDGDTTVVGSTKIARYVHDKMGLRTLFPEGREADVVYWNDLADQMLNAGRVRTCKRLSEDDAAKRESVPGFVPRALRPYSVGLVELGLRYFEDKYGWREVDGEAQLKTLTNICATLAEHLASNEGRDTLLPRFSIADIAMACALQVISPVSSDYIHLGPETTRIWTEPDLAAQYPQLLSWRDTLFSKYR